MLGVWGNIDIDFSITCPYSRLVLTVPHAETLLYTAVSTYFRQMLPFPHAVAISGPYYYLPYLSGSFSSQLMGSFVRN